MKAKIPPLALLTTYLPTCLYDLDRRACTFPHAVMQPRRALLCALLLLVCAASSTGEPSRPRFAVCLTGQLSRLELASKISRILEPNLRAGVDVDLFLFLEKSLPGAPAKQSRPKLQLGTELYTRFSAEQLQQFVTEYTRADAGGGRFRAEARLQRRDLRGSARGRCAVTPEGVHLSVAWDEPYVGSESSLLSVSADGQTLTARSSILLADGKGCSYTTVYQRRPS